MVGGQVVSVLVLAERVWVNVQDREHESSTCALYLERNAQSETVALGDELWWQGRSAFWTPAANRNAVRGGKGQGTVWDIVLPRIGYSGARHPAQDMILRAYAPTNAQEEAETP